MRLRHTTIAIAILIAAGCSSKTETPAATATATAPAPAATSAPAAAAATPAAAPAQKIYGVQELDQMLAPIALYPDSLLSQFLMAATYPGNVADAVKWSKAHPDASGDAAVKQVINEPWDPSVASLVAFPQALDVMGQDPVWVQNLGDAFLAQPEDVMDSIQRLRGKAQAAGNLESNEYQKISTQPAPPPLENPAPMVEDLDGGGGTTTVVQQAPAQTIVIEPAQPDVVYVPSYNPTTAYGNWGYPSYPPPYYPPSNNYYPGSALVSGMMWGTGLAITSSLWGGFGWNDHDVDINVNRYNDINVNNRINASNNKWQHNSANRNGVPYRDNRSRDQYSRNLDGAKQRDAFRGDDSSRAASRARAEKSMENRGVASPGGRAGGNDARTRAQAATRDMNKPGARDRAAAGAGGGDKAAARARASNATAGMDKSAARDRARTAANNPQAKGNAKTAAANRSGASGKARAPTSNKTAAAQKARSAPARHTPTQSNAKAHQAARSTQANRSAAPKHNAMSGASRPQQSHAQANRGRASSASAHRAPSHASKGKPVSRQSHPPARQGGGGHRR